MQAQQQRKRPWGCPMPLQLMLLLGVCSSALSEAALGFTTRRSYIEPPRFLNVGNDNCLRDELLATDTTQGIPKTGLVFYFGAKNKDVSLRAIEFKIRSGSVANNDMRLQLYMSTEKYNSQFMDPNSFTKIADTQLIPHPIDPDIALLPAHAMNAIALGRLSKVALYARASGAWVEHIVDYNVSPEEPSIDDNRVILFAGSPIPSESPPISQVENFVPDELDLATQNAVFSGKLHYEFPRDSCTPGTPRTLKTLVEFVHAINGPLVTPTFRAIEGEVDQQVDRWLQGDSTFMSWVNQNNLKMPNTATAFQRPWDVNIQCIDATWLECDELVVALEFRHDETLSPESLRQALYERVAKLSEVVKSQLEDTSVVSHYTGFEAVQGDFDIVLKGVPSSPMNANQQEFFANELRDYLNLKLAKAVVLNIDIESQKQMRKRDRVMVRSSSDSTHSRERSLDNSEMKVSGKVHGGQWAQYTNEDFTNTLQTALNDAANKVEFLNNRLLYNVHLPSVVSDNNDWQYFASMNDMETTVDGTGFQDAMVVDLTGNSDNNNGNNNNNDGSDNGDGEDGSDTDNDQNKSNEVVDTVKDNFDMIWVYVTIAVVAAIGGILALYCLLDRLLFAPKRKKKEGEEDKEEDITFKEFMRQHKFFSNKRERRRSKRKKRDKEQREKEKRASRALEVQALEAANASNDVARSAPPTNTQPPDQNQQQQAPSKKSSPKIPTNIVVEQPQVHGQPPQPQPRQPPTLQQQTPHYPAQLPHYPPQQTHYPTQQHPLHHPAQPLPPHYPAQPLPPHYPAQPLPQPPHHPAQPQLPHYPAQPQPPHHAPQQLHHPVQPQPQHYPVQPPPPHTPPAQVPGNVVIFSDEPESSPDTQKRRREKKDKKKKKKSRRRGRRDGKEIPSSPDDGNDTAETCSLDSSETIPEPPEPPQPQRRLSTGQINRDTAAVQPQGSMPLQRGSLGGVVVYPPNRGSAAGGVPLQRGSLGGGVPTHQRGSLGGGAFGVPHQQGPMGGAPQQRGSVGGAPLPPRRASAHAQTSHPHAHPQPMMQQPGQHPHNQAHPSAVYGMDTSNHSFQGLNPATMSRQRGTGSYGMTAPQSPVVLRPKMPPPPAANKLDSSNHSPVHHPPATGSYSMSSTPHSPVNLRRNTNVPHSSNQGAAPPQAPFPNRPKPPPSGVSGKPRFTRQEMEMRMSIKELRAYMPQSDNYKPADKHDLVEHLIHTGAIDLVTS